MRSMKFYKMYAQPSIEEYAVPGAEIEVLSQGCLYSEFQFLDHRPISVEISEEGGIIFPDFIEYQSIPLISEGMRRVFDKFNVDYVFYKPVQLTFAERGIAENYFLALPPRIDCLDYERSDYESEENTFTLPIELICDLTEPVIDKSRVGRYDIFRLDRVLSSDTIITERLKNALAAESFSNLYFDELEE